MGNGPSSLAPVTQNTCTDADDPDNQNVRIKDFCTSPWGYPEQTTREYCHHYGGTYPSDETRPNPGNEFPESEWAYASYGSSGDCLFDDTSDPNEMSGSGCNGLSCAITGAYGYCSRAENTGDPLLCCLRDYQCNTGNGSSCFSDNFSNSTCNKDFRATDTPFCNSLLTDFCLGNINDMPISNTNYPPPLNPTFAGLGTNFDFTALWTDANSPNGTVTNPNWIVNGLPYFPADYQNTGNPLVVNQFLTSQNYEANGESPCVRNQQGQFTGATADGGTCQLSTWAPGQAGQYGPQSYLPTGSPYTFNNLPPCQQIFWRTLYGNSPTFKNNLWKNYGSQAVCPDGSEICQQTSAIPQTAACGAVAFGGAPTPSGMIQAQYMLEAAVNKFTTLSGGNASLISNLGDVTDAPFTQWVFSVCSQYPELCQNFLKNTCSSLTQEDLITNPTALQWCGCYLDNTQFYKKYIDTYGVSKECTPYCNVADVIPSFDAETGQIKKCEQSVCIIDKVTLDLAKSRISGGINFNQICNSCSGSGSNGVNVYSNTASSNLNASTDSQTVSNNTVNISCQCLINSVNLTTIGASIEGGINISQACNGNAKCFSDVKLDNSADTSTQEVDCHSGTLNSNRVIAEAEAALLKKANDTSNYWIIFLLITIIFVVILLWILISPSKVPNRDINFTKRIDLSEPAGNSFSQFIYPSNTFTTNVGAPQKAKFF